MRVLKFFSNKLIAIAKGIKKFFIWLFKIQPSQQKIGLFFYAMGEDWSRFSAYSSTEPVYCLPGFPSLPYVLYSQFIKKYPYMIDDAIENPHLEFLIAYDLGKKEGEKFLNQLNEKLTGDANKVNEAIKASKERFFYYTRKYKK